MSRVPCSLWPEGGANPALSSVVGQLRAALAGCQTVLDVGCGKSSPLRFVPGPHLVGVDGFGPSLEEARAGQTHDEFLTGDVRKLSELFPTRKFDACVALDVIEHLPKEDGWQMLKSMEQLAKKRVIIFTPNGFVPQKSQDGDLQEHLSGWTPEELQPLGYQVLGMCGPKSLRGEYHRIKYRPRVFWVLLSTLADYTYTRSHPASAAAILAIKHMAR